MQKRVFRSIFIPEKYVFKVCFESRFTRMVSSLKYKWPPGQRSSPFLADFWDFFELFHNFISTPLSKNPLWSSQLVCPIPSPANNFPFRPCRTLEASFLEDLVPPSKLVCHIPLQLITLNTPCSVGPVTRGQFFRRPCFFKLRPR